MASGAKGPEVTADPSAGANDGESANETISAPPPTTCWEPEQLAVTPLFTELVGLST